MLPNGAASAQQSTENYKYDVLGRLVAVETAGGQNDEEVHSLCYDAAGNRVEFKATSDGTEAACVSQGTAGGGSGGGGGEDPPPPPPPGNNPPATQNDSVFGNCYASTIVNLTANDTDPEGNYPLSLVSIMKTNSGGGSADLWITPSSVEVFFGGAYDLTTFEYTVADSLGATSTGQLSTSTSTCGGGGGNEN